MRLLLILFKKDLQLKNGLWELEPSQGCKLWIIFNPNNKNNYSSKR